MVKHLVIFTSEFPPGPGGIGTQAQALASFFHQKGVRITVVTAKSKAFDHEKYDQQLPYRVIRYQTNYFPLIKLFFNLLHVWLIRNTATHVLLSGISQLFLIGPLRWLTKAKLLVILHGHELRMSKKWRKRLLLKFLEEADFVVAVSEFSKNISITEGLNKRVRVIPNGIHVKPVAESRSRSFNPLKLVTVGSITFRKGQLNVIRALPAIIKAVGAVEYHLIGIPAEESFLRKEARELGVEDCIIVHGVLSNKQRDDILGACHIFMMLSENLKCGDVEGFGIAMLEANLFGVPGIGSQGTGLEQVIKTGYNGYLVNPHKEEEIVQAVLLIVNNYDDLSANSRKRAADHDWSQIGEQYWELVNGR